MLKKSQIFTIVLCFEQAYDDKRCESSEYERDICDKPESGATGSRWCHEVRKHDV